MKNAKLLGRGASAFIYSIFPVISCLFFTNNINAQAPSANFTANVVSGCSPLIVQFTDQSTGSPTSWYWDFGNGSTSSVQNPTATFTTAGTYTVVLTATNGSGSNTVTKTNYITVAAAPVAKFTSNDSAGCTPLAVQFTDQSTTANGTIAQWEWNFGDGATSNVQNPTHTYTLSGTFNVYLKVTTSVGCTQTIFKQQYIKTGSGAAADFNINMPNVCQAPVTVSFTNNSQTGGNVNYSWNFGDGGTSNAINPSHTYSNYGTFTVTLSIQSAGGCASTKQKTINFSQKDVSFSGPTTVCIGSAATYTMTSSPAPISQTWTISDGSSYTDTSITHTFASAGTYTITLANEFTGGCNATKTQTVNVIAGPSIDFSADTTKACKPPLAVKFTATGGATGFNWDFGDGNNSTQQNPSHTYQVTGNFTVKLSASNAAGCVSQVEKNSFIIIQPPTVAISNLPVTNGCTPYAFSPVASINAPDGVASYLWDFGNGMTSTSANPTNTYTTAGSYTVKLRITTKGGCTDSVIYTNGIITTDGVNVDFSASPTVACVDAPVSFTPITGGTPQTYTWYFGDGENSTLSNPTHPYKHSDNYNVTLEVNYGSCISRVTKTNYITVSPPEAKFSAARDCNNKRLINFTNQTIGVANAQWDFGDGSTSTTISPQHLYSSDGTYNVTLTMNNGTCSHSLTQQIEVSSASISITSSRAIVCKKDLFTLKAILPNSIDASSYQWTISTFNTTTTLVDSLVWLLYNPGNYNVTLNVLTRNGCQETVSINNFITAYGPTANFKTDKIGGCLNTSINFTDSSVTDGVHNVTQWAWDFGDTTTGSGASVSHAYSTRGKYNVSLKVTDSYGCSDIRVKPNFVNITNGKAMFAAMDPMSCRGKDVVFSDTSSGTISYWEWDFGDGNTLSGVQSPAHTYQDSGYYSVKLKITENSGCSDSITKQNYVTIKDPKAAFALSDTFSTCPPLTVNFYDHSYYVKQWAWDFGDGGGSPIANPINLYNTPNLYTVKLVVTSHGGCTDSAFANVHILGPYGQFTYTPLAGCTPLPVTYSVTSQSAVKFLWDYSDGNVDSGTVANSSHTYNTGGRFVPKVILTDAQGCRVPVIGKDTVYIQKTVVDFNAATTTFCDTGTVAFTNTSTINSPSVAYQWFFGDENSSNNQNATHLYLTPGWYNVTLKATTPLGCVDTLTKDAYIRINNSPVASVISQDSLCKPASFTFTAQLQPDTSGIKKWNWTFGNGQTSDQQNPSPQIFSTEGTYTNTLFIEDNQGCSTTVSKTVVVNPLPVVQASQDPMICRGNSAQLSATGAVSYTWIAPNNDLSCTDCANPVASPLYDIQYKVEGRSSLGCVAYDSVWVKVLQPYKITVDPISDSICVGKGVSLKAYGAPLYSWSPATSLNAANIANPFATPSASTSYHVVGYDSLGCFKDSADVNITVLPVPTVNAGTDITLSAGSTAVIQSTASGDVTTYIWSPATGLSCTDCPNPTVTGGSDITYSVKCTNAAGCTAMDQVKISVTCSEANVFIPNTFTPNGDGMNDVFYIRGKGLYAVKSLKIFNRWGEMVFEKKDVNPNDARDGWDGMYKGKIASTDTYVYQLEVLCNNKQVMKYTGTISLVR